MQPNGSIYRALLLFFTITITSVAAERSFSKLKIIKNNLKNNMGQTRLRHLSLIAIENNTASSLDLNEVIDTFAKTIIVIWSVGRPDLYIINP